jgi:hypothetical protein
MNTAIKKQNRLLIYIFPIIPVFVSILLFYIPSLADTLQFNRKEMFSYKIYLFLTCHFTHWNVRHMVIDTFIFFALSYLCIFFSFKSKYSIVQYIIYLLIPSILISTAVLIFNPEIKFYRGLSGIDWALYFILMAQLYFAAHWLWKTGAIIMFFLFSLMMIHQIVSKHSIFVPDMGEGIVTVPSAHIAGALSGIACTLIYRFLLKQK